ncbi:hypothetical protein KKF05_00915 [Patescibacteria group bacterium]|nr:hypothetical protein [Patescibacteria group bacterium]
MNSTKQKSFGSKVWLRGLYSSVLLGRGADSGGRADSVADMRNVSSVSKAAEAASVRPLGGARPDWLLAKTCLLLWGSSFILNSWNCVSLKSFHLYASQSTLINLF